MKLENKVAIVTGGGKGIGAEICLRLAKEGAKIVIAEMDIENGEKISKKIQDNNGEAIVVETNVAEEDSANNMADGAIKKFGKIDILINNAGVSMRALVQDVDFDTIRRVMDINFWGTVYCTKFALDHIVKNKGTIVGVSSIAGYRGLPGRSGYSASKYAVNGWLEALRTELLESGTNVMWVCPGFTSSNIRNAALNSKGESQGESPMDEGAMMSSEECAGHIANAIEKRKRTLVLTFTGKRAVFMNKFFPALADKLVRKFFFKNNELVK